MEFIGSGYGEVKVSIQPSGSVRLADKFEAELKIIIDKL